MRIGILGGGRVGSALAERWTRAAHGVQVSSRETLRQTAEGAEVVVLAVPAAALDEVVAVVGDVLDGKVLVDATNDLRPEPGGALALAGRVPSARVVKAFNTVFAPAYEAADRAEMPPTMVFCGDDEAAKRIVDELIRDLGFEPVDAGGLDRAPDVEAFARLVIGIAYAQGRGPFLYRFTSA